MKKIKIIRSRPLKEEEEVIDQQPQDVAPAPPVITFESNPLEFILQKYPTLTKTLIELLTEDFRDYITGVYIMAPKPTIFKIVLHNNRYFHLMFMGDNKYEAKVSGKKYWLSKLSELQEATMAIADLLMLGTPPSVEGPSEELPSAEGTEGPEETPVETPEETPAEEEGGVPELKESIKRFKIVESLLLEAEQKKSVLFEAALVLGWYKAKYGKGYEKKVPEDAVSESELALIKTKYPDLIDKGMKAVINLGLTKGKSAYSAGKLTAPLTPFWTSYGATNKTSKADVILGDARVSVKAGPSQLMSGAKEETKATFYAALKKCPELVNTKEVKEILKAIEGFAKAGRTQGKIAPALKAGKDKALLAANAANKKAMSLLQNLFATNEKFATEFAKEAMSGDMKFGSKSLAYAEYILAVDSNYDNAVLHKTTDNKYAKKVADQMKLEVRFKTGSIKSKGNEGQYGYFTVLGLHSDPTKLEKKPVKEGIFDNVKDFFSNIWDKITSSVTSLVNFFAGGSENIEVDVQGEESIDFS
jgi:hypothetical protein